MKFAFWFPRRKPSSPLPRLEFMLGLDFMPVRLVEPGRLVDLRGFKPARLESRRTVALHLFLPTLYFALRFATALTLPRLPFRSRDLLLLLLIKDLQLKELIVLMVLLLLKALLMIREEILLGKSRRKTTK